MAFQNAYLKRILSLKSASFSLRTHALWQLSGISDYLMDWFTTPFETWAHINDLKEGRTEKLNLYSFSGFKIYAYGRSEIRQILKRQDIPMRRLLLSATDFINSKPILQAATRIERRLVKCTRKAFKNPSLTSSDVKKMLSDL